MPRRLLLGALLVLVLAVPAAAPAGTDDADTSTARLRSAGLVELVDRAPTIQLDLRYATDDNFTGARLPGYCEPLAYMRRRAARALARVQKALAEDGLGLRVFDAYRPARASRAMVRWARRTGHAHLLGGYIALRSNHNRGIAVDLTLVRLASGRALNMGTAYDALTTRAHTLNASGGVLRNRLSLRSAMGRAGFRNYHREWWHYDYLRDPRAPRLDLPLGC